LEVLQQDSVAAPTRVLILEAFNSTYSYHQSTAPCRSVSVWTSADGFEKIWSENGWVRKYSDHWKYQDFCGRNALYVRTWLISRLWYFSDGSRREKLNKNILMFCYLQLFLVMFLRIQYPQALLNNMHVIY
jgi:hypothetical protein